jgi:hypothetical protein
VKLVLLVRKNFEAKETGDERVGGGGEEWGTVVAVFSYTREFGVPFLALGFPGLLSWRAKRGLVKMLPFPEFAGAQR